MRSNGPNFEEPAPNAVQVMDAPDTNFLLTSHTGGVRLDVFRGNWLGQFYTMDITFLNRSRTAAKQFSGAWEFFCN